MMSYRIGVDIGGTFTDFALFEESGGRLALHKQLTTPSDPSQAVLDGIVALLARQKVPIAEVRDVVHGTTLVTNSVIERTGAKTGMLVTSGFRDIPDMRMEQRYDLFDLRLAFPDPLVPRRLRREVAERVHYDGRVETPLDEAELTRGLKELVEGERIEALAICFLHSYANPTHEHRAKAMAEAAYPELYVSASVDVFSNMREFERWTTTTVNAYTQPMFDRYIARLEQGLAARGFKGQLYIMTSSGGIVTTETARRFPVRALESGPAAGVLMSAVHGRTLGLPDLLSFDMGGTTAKGALVRKGAPLKKYSMEVARVHEFKRGSGLPLCMPVIDMIEIGAGGGSIAQVDARNLIAVGPRSAGAVPGPACYGQGGQQAALTDANLVLGYLDAGSFLGGEMRLDVPAAEAAIGKSIARPLKLDLARAAWGIHEVINEDVARAFRIHASERGFDYRTCSMVTFGGSGPVHALAVARKLRIPRVIFPLGAGVMSALGLLASPLAFEVALSRRVFLTDLDADRFAALLRPLVEEAAGFLGRAGVKPADLRMVRRLDIRYEGQGYEVEVELPADRSAESGFHELPKLFAAAYETAFGHNFLDEPLEIVTWKVEAVGPEPHLKADFSLVVAGNGDARAAVKGRRKAYFEAAGGYVDCLVYDRYRLQPGDIVNGPALVEERESTAVLGPEDSAAIDPHYNLVAELAG